MRAKNGVDGIAGDASLFHVLEEGQMELIPVAEAWALLGIPDPLPLIDGLLAATGGGRETVSSGGTALGATLSASAQLRVSSGGVAISTTGI